MGIPPWLQNYRPAVKAQKKAHCSCYGIESRHSCANLLVLSAHLLPRVSNKFWHCDTIFHCSTEIPAPHGHQFPNPVYLFYHRLCPSITVEPFHCVMLQSNTWGHRSSGSATGDPTAIPPHSGRVMLLRDEATYWILKTNTKWFSEFNS